MSSEQENGGVIEEQNYKKRKQNCKWGIKKTYGIMKNNNNNNENGRMEWKKRRGEGEWAWRAQSKVLFSDSRQTSEEYSCIK